MANKHKSLFHELICRILIFLLIIVLLLVFPGCGNSNREFSIVGEWEEEIPLTEEELQQYHDLYEMTHHTIYRDVVARYCTYVFSENGTFTFTWVFIDNKGIPFKEPADGSYNTGECIEGTYVFENSILARSIIIDENLVYTDEWRITADNNDSYQMTLVKLNGKELKDNQTLSFHRKQK